MLCSLQSLGDQRQIYVPQKTAEAQEDHTFFDRAVGRAEEIGNRPDLIRVPDEFEELLHRRVS